MQKLELIKQLEDSGYKITRQGIYHIWYSNEITQKSQPVPRDREIDDHLAKHILKELSN